MAFEVAGIMSRTVHLWHTLDDAHVARLRHEVLHLKGVRKLVADDDGALLALAVAEMADSLRSLSRSVARLAGRCSDPLLQRFGRLFAEVVKSGADPHGFQYATKKMARKAKKMERLVGATTNLYQELEVLAELEQRAASASGMGHKVLWQSQEVRYLRAASLWNRSYDYTVRLLGRSLFTIVARIRHVFGLGAGGLGDAASGNHGADSRIAGRLSRTHSMAGLTHSTVHPSDCGGTPGFASGPLGRPIAKSGPIGSSGDNHRSPPSKGANLKLKWPVAGSPFKRCMVGGNEPPVLQSCIFPDNAAHPRASAAATGLSHSGAASRGSTFDAKLALSMFEPLQTALRPPESTLGAAALALHYANVIILIEKLAVSPHLISPDARDDLYSMLTVSIRASLRARLKSYAKNLASSVYDPVLAAEWTEAVQRILGWLAPLAHNMVRWQSERNVEQRHVVSSGNMLLLQTLYFANQKKAEAAITELLVGLNYLWRSGRELNAKAMPERAGSGNHDDCLDSIG